MKARLVNPCDPSRVGIVQFKYLGDNKEKVDQSTGFILALKKTCAVPRNEEMTPVNVDVDVGEARGQSTKSAKYLEIVVLRWTSERRCLDGVFGCRKGAAWCMVRTSLGSWAV